MLPLDWQWTNAEHTEARADRWTVTKREPSALWHARHDDFPDVWWDSKSSGGKTTNAWQARQVLSQFRAWRDSQPITLEHREGEYVHLGSRSTSDPEPFHWEFSEGVWVSTSWGAVWSPSEMLHTVKCDTVISHGFLAPGTITKAQPPEPTTFGYVGTVVTPSGDEWDVVHDYAPASVAYTCVSRHTGAYNGSRDWAFVLALGTFEGVVR